MSNLNIDSDFIFNIQLDGDNIDNTHNIIENTNIDNCLTDKNCVPIKIYTGVDGISAYELALRKGFVGSEDEWLQLLYFNRDVFLSESEYELLVRNDAVDLAKKYLIYEDDN